LHGQELGFHGLRVEGYNLSKRGNGEDTLSPGADAILEDGVRFLALRPVCFHGLVFFVLCAGFQFGVCGFLQWCNSGLA